MLKYVTSEPLWQTITNNFRAYSYSEQTKMYMQRMLS
jgi:hypothetical protein